MVKQELKITVRRPGEKPISIAEFKKLTWMRRLALKWFGGVEKVMVIVPSDSVQSVEIREEGNNAKFENASQNKTI